MYKHKKTSLKSVLSRTFNLYCREKKHYKGYPLGASIPVWSLWFKLKLFRFNKRAAVESGIYLQEVNSTGGVLFLFRVGHFRILVFKA